MTSKSDKILNLFEFNEESNQILNDCAKYNITNTNVESVYLKSMETMQKKLEMDMTLLECEAELEKLEMEMDKNDKWFEMAGKSLEQHVKPEEDLKTAKMILKLSEVNEQVQTPEDLKSLIKKVKKIL